MIVELEPCAYCGMPADSKDHVIPRSYSRMMYDVHNSRSKLLETFGETVPCCHECNSLLGATPALTVPERKKFVKAALKKRYRKVLKMPNWSEDEIDALKGLLQEHVKQRKMHKELIEGRLSW